MERSRGLPRSQWVPCLVAQTPVHCARHCLVQTLRQRSPAPVSTAHTTALSMACLNPLVPALYPKQRVAAQPGATMAMKHLYFPCFFFLTSTSGSSFTIVPPSPPHLDHSSIPSSPATASRPQILGVYLPLYKPVPLIKVTQSEEKIELFSTQLPFRCFLPPLNTWFPLASASQCLFFFFLALPDYLPHLLLNSILTSCLQRSL